jgi:hypothetical protein
LQDFAEVFMANCPDHFDPSILHQCTTDELAAIVWTAVPYDLRSLSDAELLQVRTLEQFEALVHAKKRGKSDGDWLPGFH